MVGKLIDKNKKNYYIIIWILKNIQYIIQVRTLVKKI